MSSGNPVVPRYLPEYVTIQSQHVFHLDLKQKNKAAGQRAQRLINVGLCCISMRHSELQRADRAPLGHKGRSTIDLKITVLQHPGET